MHCLVTGATGFIGQHLIRELMKNKYSVRCFVRGGLKRNQLDNLGLDVKIGDLTDKKSLKDALNNIEVVFHCAGLLGDFNLNESEYHEVNVRGTQNIIELSQKTNIKKFIFLSSAGVIGPTGAFLGDERFPYKPSNIYEQTKAIAEECVKKSGLTYVIIRPEFVYGEGDYHVLALFEAIQKRRFFLINNGNSTLHPTYVSDLVGTLLLCLEKKIKNQTYIIAGPRPVTVKEIWHEISKALNINSFNITVPSGVAHNIAGIFERIGKSFHFKPILTKQRVKFFTENRAFSIEKARVELGYEPKISFKEGVEISINWYKQQGLLK